MATAMAAQTGSGMAAAGTVAMAVAVNNRNCGGRQQSTKCGSGHGGDSGPDSGNRASVALMAGRGGRATEVNKGSSNSDNSGGDFIPS